MLQHGSGHGALRKGFPGEDLDGGLAGGQRIQLPQPLLLPAPGDHRCIIEGQIPAGQYGGGQTQKVLQLLLQTPCGNVILTQDDHGCLAVPVQTGDQVAAVDLTDAGDGGTLPLGQGIRQSLVFRYGFEHGKKLFHSDLQSRYRENASPRGKAERGMDTPFP